MRRRSFLAGLGGASLALPSLGPALARGGRGEKRGDSLTLFLCGDVMTGRGIDQVLPHSVGPRLYEPYVRNAEVYVQLAEEESGEIPGPVPFDYVWGDALAELERVAPHLRIVNLETAVTTAHDPWPGKGIHYRMHPGNVPVLTAAGLDVCVLGNNHVLDWGRDGLRQTLDVLRKAGIAAPGAGADHDEAARPAVLETEAGRILVFSWGLLNAGVPPTWRAGKEAGVSLLSSPDREGAEGVVEEVERVRQPGDRVVVSLHWGPNWGYEVPEEERSFAHRLIDSGMVDVIHGHSSHHPKGIEVYRGRPIIYGAGDFLNDYEGIAGNERFRGELTLMYFPTLAPSGELIDFGLTPLRIHRFRLQRAAPEEVTWMARTLDEHSRPFGTRVIEDGSGKGRLGLRWG